MSSKDSSFQHDIRWFKGIETSIKGSKDNLKKLPSDCLPRSKKIRDFVLEVP